MAVLRTAEDFADLATAYLDRARADGVTRVEMFFDPQMHLSRGVPLTEVIGGLRAAADRSAASGGPQVGLIACFLRDRGPDDAAATLEALAGHAGELLGVGLDSAEVGYPPGDFAGVFDDARGARAAHRRARRRGGAARVRLAGARPARRGARRPRHPQRRGPRAAAAARGRPYPADRLPAVERPAALRRRDRRATRSPGCSTPASTSRSTPTTPPTSAATSPTTTWRSPKALASASTHLAALAANSLDRLPGPPVTPG